MPFDDAVHQPLAVRLVGDVAGDGVGAANLLGQRRETVGAARGEDRRTTGMRDRTRELGAKPGAGSCDDDDMTIELRHIRNGILLAEVSSTVSRARLQRKHDAPTGRKFRRSGIPGGPVLCR